MVVAVAESHILITGTYESSRVAWLQPKKTSCDVFVAPFRGQKLWGRIVFQQKKGPQIPFWKLFLELIRCFFDKTPVCLPNCLTKTTAANRRKDSQKSTTRYDSLTPKTAIDVGDVKMDGPHGPSWEPSASSLGMFGYFFWGGREGGWSHAKFIQIFSVPKFRVATGALFRGSFWAGDLLILVCQPS